MNYEIFALQGDLAAINARVKGMSYANDQRLHLGQSVAFGEDHFFEAEADLLTVSQKIRDLSKTGNLDIAKLHKELETWTPASNPPLHCNWIEGQTRDRMVYTVWYDPDSSKDEPTYYCAEDSRFIIIVRWRELPEFNEGETNDSN
jgi:hypothetical protein